MKYYLFLLYVLLLPLFFSCKQGQERNPSALFWQRDAAETNIDFVNQLPATGPLNLMTYPYFYNGAGVAAGDVNNDGLTDLFFVQNKGENKLYLNKGKSESSSFSFQDITAESGLGEHSDWETGVTMADVNGDGWLDIYVCALVGFQSLKGHNRLYINKGVDASGNVSFTEQAAEWGLDFQGYSTQATFFDCDQDGDLDMYLLNHAAVVNLNYGIADMDREEKDERVGDVLYENQLNGVAGQAGKAAVAKFIDVSEQAGIYQSPMDIGLGVVVADFNQDGWDDIYVANDFHEDDFCYINQGDGTFKESIRERFRYLSRFSMGCDAADLNNDGYPDLMTLDMFPENEVVEKTSMGEEAFLVMKQKMAYGFMPQYSRNCLQLNLSGEKFSEIGYMAGVAATDWSWSTLLADFDNDGQKDIFIGNGIARRQNDLDFIRYFSNTALNLRKSEKIDQELVEAMPSGKVPNFIFRGTKSLQFEDKSQEWGFGSPTLSSGSLYTDLDGDGDLELVTNNINEPAGIYENRSQELHGHHYLKVKLQGQGANTYGVGAKVFVMQGGTMQYQQQMPTRGFLSSVEPTLTFGLGKQTKIDSVLVLWGNQKAQVIKDVSPDQTLELAQVNATASAAPYYAKIFSKPEPLLEEVSTSYVLNYAHQENDYNDFAIESLMPFQLSTEGPKMAVGDVNGDGLEDFYVGGASRQAGSLFLQGANRGFMAGNSAAFLADADREDVDALFFDADGDKDLDLYVVSAGNEHTAKKEQLLDRLYLNDGKGNFTRMPEYLPELYSHTSCVRANDFDGDGDLDLFVGGRVEGGAYGHIPDSYLLMNDGKGRFSDQTEQLAPGLRKAGMLTDAQWVDYDGNGLTDLVVVGDWMSVKFFRNTGRQLQEVKNVPGLEQSNGFWQTVQAADFDGDGDPDFLIGNLGINSKLRRHNGTPLKMLVKDVDENQKQEHILMYQRQEKWYPVANKEELGKQLPQMNKKFKYFKDYAGKTVAEIFNEGEMEGALELEVDRFESVYLENLGGGKFKQHLLPVEAQTSKIWAFHVMDVDSDGHQDVLLGGNFWGVSAYQGRYDANWGLVLKGDGKGNFKALSPTECGFLLKGEVRDIKSVNTPAGPLVLVARNNLPIQFFSPRAVVPSMGLMANRSSENAAK
ncbi:VCBS repeat-containing protein [Pontibacter brevis]